MKTAVKALVALAAVFFGDVALADLSAYFATAEEAAAWRGARRQACSGSTSGGSWSGSSVVSSGGQVWTRYSSTSACDCDGVLYAYVPSGWSCPSGEFVDQATGLCTLPPGSAGDVNCTVPEDKIFVSIPAGGRSFCKTTGNVGGGSNCEWAMNGSSMVLADGKRYGYAELTKLTCPASPPPAPTDPPTEPGPGCIVAGGEQICVSKTKPNCGEVNGSPVCVDTPPPGNCTFLPGGNWVCDAAAPTPPKPTKAGLPDPSIPVVTFDGRGKTGQPASATVHSRADSSASGGDAGSTYNGGGTGVGEDGGGSCGGEGEPACKIDEEGTPTVEESEFTGSDGSGALDAAVAGAGSGEGSGQASDGQTAGSRGAAVGKLPVSGDCGPIVWTFQGSSVELDGFTRCAPVREGLAWLFGLSAALFILMLIFRPSVA